MPNGVMANFSLDIIRCMIIDEGLGERAPAFVSTYVEALLIRPT